MRQFELHITMVGDDDKIRYHTLARGGKYSRIDGDPILGAGIKQYATFHTESENPADVINITKELAEAFSMPEVRVLRFKVEEIIFDSSRGDA